MAPYTLTVTHYTTAAKVASALQCATFVDSPTATKPSLAQVNEFIARADDEIDRRTGHAWRERFSQSSTVNDTACPNYEYHDLGTIYYATAGIPVHLKHRCIRELDSAKDDEFKVWDGTQYVDYLANRTKGRGSDWWMDNEAGKIYILDTRRALQDVSVQLKYRYGETAVPGDIEEAATCLVCRMIALLDDRAIILEDSSSGPRPTDKIEYWTKRSDKLIADRAEYRVHG